MRRWILVLLAFGFFSSSLYAEDEELFKEFEIRVIRPRYFIKRKRLEFGIQSSVIMNQTFYYTGLLVLNADFHFTEQFAFELVGAYGKSFAKEDQIFLKNDFKIQTQFAPTELYYGSNFLWTPMYGKFQLSQGRLIYFDTFLSLGGGMIGVRENYDHCLGDTDFSSRIFQYPYWQVGLGQRFFVSKNDSVRWDIQSSVYTSDTADTACHENATGESSFNQNITFQLGYSRFL